MHKHKKSLGQHFIKDLNVHRKIVSRGGAIEGSNVVEIGPGDGNLSRMILEARPKTLVMIEKDDDLKDRLQQILDESCNAKLIFGDGATIDLRNIVEKPAKIIANLPYNVATNMVMNWLEYKDFFESMTVLVQKEVANKFLLAGNRLNLMATLHYDVKKDFDLPPDVFIPKPKVDSTLMTFSLLREKRFYMDWTKLNKLTKAGFAQPRKTILNNLRAYNRLIDEDFLKKCGVEPKKRPENLTLEDFYLIYQVVFAND